MARANSARRAASGGRRPWYRPANGVWTVPPLPLRRKETSMSIKRRLRRLEAKTSAEPPRNPGDRPNLTAPAIRELDELIARLEAHVSKQEADQGEGYDEAYDEALYGESLADHARRVDALMEALDERDGERRRSHRPDLVGVPNEIDERIAEIEAEIEEEGGGGLT